MKHIVGSLDPDSTEKNLRAKSIKSTWKSLFSVLSSLFDGFQSACLWSK